MLESNALNAWLESHSLPLWVFPLGLGVLLFFILMFVRRVVLNGLNRRAPLTKTLIDDLAINLLKSIKAFFIFAIAVYFSIRFLELPPSRENVATKLFILVFLFQFWVSGSVGVNFWISNHLRKKAEKDAESATTLGLISFAAKALLLVLIVLLALNNLGVNITALVAGLGVGGIAVALALQNILGDLFASLTIVLDKPFNVGDFIVVGDFKGSIEHIGLKTTRIRSLSGEQLILANGDLLQSRIRNFKRMSERRVIYTLGVTYQTTPEALRSIPGVIENIVKSVGNTRFDRCHLLKFTESTLEFEIVYWVLDSNFNVYADIAQKVHFKTYEEFNSRKIDFAYPSRTLFIQRDEIET